MYIYYKILLENTYKINQNELKNDVDIFSKLSTLDLIEELYKGYCWVREIQVQEIELNPSVKITKKSLKKKYTNLLSKYKDFFDSLDSSLKLILVTLGYNEFSDN